MQYANVIVNHPTANNPLSYALHPDILARVQIGSVVVVPFGRTTIHGVIASFTREVDPALRGQIRPIARVIYAGPAVEPTRLTAVYELHRQWALNPGPLLFRYLPQFPLRPQSLEIKPLTTNTGSRFQTYTYQIPLNLRVTWYAGLAVKLIGSRQSVVVVTSTQAYAQSLSSQLSQLGIPNDCLINPANTKACRDFWINTVAATVPRVILGTRKVLMSRLESVGAICVDEPWLPGHKDDYSPKLWSVFVARALAQSLKIPLLLVTSLTWPDSRLISTSRTRRVGPDVDFTNVVLTPKRPIEQQIVHFEMENSSRRRKLIVVHPSSGDAFWCPRCHRMNHDDRSCQSCGQPTIHFPPLSVDAVREKLVAPNTTVATFANMPIEAYDSILALGFDALLSITDWRGPIYIGTVVGHLSQTAESVLLATAHPDVWTRILFAASRDRLAPLNKLKELAVGPFGTLIRLTSPKRQNLDVALSLVSGLSHRIYPIRRGRDQFLVDVSLKPQVRLPSALARLSSVKYDILPLYIES